jgi:hypothetical protein
MSDRPSNGTAALLASLQSQQERVLGILEGVPEADLHRAVLPSGWSCLGMLHHLTLGSRFWLQDVMTGARSEWPEGDDFDVPATASIEEVIDGYRRESQRAAALVADLPPDTPPAWWPEGEWGGWRLTNLREVLLHLLVETSCHAGHLDVVRELLDGGTWDYGTGQVAVPVVATSS